METSKEILKAFGIENIEIDEISEDLFVAYVNNNGLDREATEWFAHLMLGEEVDAGKYWYIAVELNRYCLSDGDWIVLRHGDKCRLVLMEDYEIIYTDEYVKRYLRR